MREILIRNSEHQHLRRQYALLLRIWQTDPLLKSVRDEDAISRLEAESGRKWREFWDQVQKSYEQNW